MLFLIHGKSHAARQDMHAAGVNFTRLIRPYVITQPLMQDVNLCAVRNNKKPSVGFGEDTGSDRSLKKRADASLGPAK